jgi:hypothetical protein
LSPAGRATIGSASAFDHEPQSTAGYEAPALIQLGGFAEQTQSNNFCLFGKQLGGSDGFTFMGISVPISNCSS